MPPEAAHRPGVAVQSGVASDGAERPPGTVRYTCLQRLRNLMRRAASCTLRFPAHFSDHGYDCI